MWCGVHPTLCPRRTSTAAVFMSHGDDTLTGPECSRSARRRTAGRSRTRGLGARRTGRCHSRSTSARSS
ncbi:hypothetical protein FM106_29355 [Brachybacterium faecium]|nr:hypothetical protein FM106_29355 [Brachybacterium faecium]